MALFAHLAAMVAGFGAVLVIDWIGMLWVLGRRSLSVLGGRTSGPLLVSSAATAMVSQVCWWASMFIGFHNHQS